VEGCLHERFADQAERTPEAVALIDGEREISYRDLDLESNRIAHHLQGLGVGPEVPVGLCLERGAGMVAAILGVLKAGGAYVPLDSAYPAERRRLTLEDSGARLLVDAASLAEAQSQPASPPNSPASLDNIAYVIYTSGSTGRPKGVAISHRTAAALLDWSHEVYRPEQIAYVLAATSICFDLSIFELFVPLTRGGTVVLAANALALPTLPAAARVTLVNTVPSALAELVGSGGLPASVATVNLAGEALPPALVEQIYAVKTVDAVYNLYGPSEDTTYSTWALMPRDLGTTCAIGRPLTGSRAYVLDAGLSPLPAGAAGELLLAGAGLARGYLGRPELTAERFVPDPFGGEPGGRLYRTGDLARWRTNGALDFLGRIDQQVKIRGFRVEPGEIETALLAHPGVERAVVLAREDRPGDRNLVAYVVQPETAGVSESDLKAHLRGTLPEHMIPSRIVALAALPLTPNGKVDRRALPAPERPAAGREVPRDLVELELQKIWEQVLGVPVGIDDDFFDLGGHSLLALKVVTRIGLRFGRALPVATLFQAGTVESVALRLRHAVPPQATPLVEIRSGGGSETLFFVHPGGGGVLGYSPLARRLDARRFYGLQAPGLEDEREPLGSVDELAELYLQSVRAAQPKGPYRLGGWSMGGLVALEMARRLEREGHVVDLVVLLDTRFPAASPALPEDIHGDRRLLSAFAAEIGLPRKDLDGLGDLSAAPDANLDAILERVREAGVLPPDLDERLLMRRFAVFRANVRAMREASVRPYGGRTVLFTAEEAPAGAAEAWRTALPRLAVETASGSHYTLIQEPHVSRLAERLKTYLQDSGA